MSQEELTGKINILRNETREEANTAERVGGLMQDIVDELFSALAPVVKKLAGYADTFRANGTVLYDVADSTNPDKNKPGLMPPEAAVSIVTLTNQLNNLYATVNTIHTAIAGVKEVAVQRAVAGTAKNYIYSTGDVSGSNPSGACVITMKDTNVKQSNGQLLLQLGAWNPDPSTYPGQWKSKQIPVATATADGAMGAADKKKLDGYAATFRANGTVLYDVADSANPAKNKPGLMPPEAAVSIVTLTNQLNKLYTTVDTINSRLAALEAAGGEPAQCSCVPLTEGDINEATGAAGQAKAENA